MASLLKKSANSKFKTIEIEMLALKRQSNSMVQQLATLTLEMQKKNHNSSHGESSASHLLRKEHLESRWESFPKSIRIEFPSFYEEDLRGWLYKAIHFFLLFYNTLPHQKLRLAFFIWRDKL